MMFPHLTLAAYLIHAAGKKLLPPNSIVQWLVLILLIGLIWIIGGICIPLALNNWKSQLPEK